MFALSSLNHKGGVTGTILHAHLMGQGLTNEPNEASLGGCSLGQPAEQSNSCGTGGLAFTEFTKYIYSETCVCACVTP